MTHIISRELQPPNMWYEFGATILKHPMGGHKHAYAHTGVCVFTQKHTHSIHCVVDNATGPHFLAKQVLHKVHSRASSFISVPKGQPVATYVFSSSLPFHPFFSNVLEDSSCARCDQSN